MRFGQFVIVFAALMQAGTSFSQSAEARTEGGARHVPEVVGVEPFSTLAVAVKVGIGGVGVDVATPVASRLNLRVGASFFSYNPNLVEDGINIVGNIDLRSVNESFDFFPFGNALRVSPGITFYNGNHINATAAVPAGQSFQLNNVVYISSPTDPVHGSFDMSFGHQLAPSLTVGFGNMIPRRGGHWSVPFEIGAEYLGKPPAIVLSLGGTACVNSTAPSNCTPIASSPTEMKNLVGEQNQFNSNIPTQLRFFPIISTGVSYRFGRSAKP